MANIDSNAEFIRGTEGDDTIYGGDANQIILGEDGNDFLMGRLGENYLSGGEGNDTLMGGFGAGDFLNGDAGNDTYRGEQGGKLTYQFFANWGNDTIYHNHYDVHNTLSTANDEIIISGIKYSNIAFTRYGTNLEIRDSSTGATVTIVNGLKDASYLSNDILGPNMIAKYTFSSFEEGNFFLNINDILEIVGEEIQSTIPIATDDFARGMINEDIVINVLDNDYDNDEGDFVVLDYVKLVSGVAEVNQNEDSTITVNASTQGEVKISYRIIDNAGNTARATVTVDILGDVNDGLYHGHPEQTIMLTDSNDDFQGEDVDDSVLGLAGNDNVKGGDGFDVLDGGDGADILTGGLGNDYLRGGEGDYDNLFGNEGMDVLFGDGGRDILYGGDDNDVLQGGQGNDDLFGGNHNDRLLGDEGDDYMDGGYGDDTLTGGTGNDRLYGGYNHIDNDGNEDGSDILDGGEGNDALYGGLGGDILRGGAGNDFMDGGIGSDAIQFEEGQDKIVTDSLDTVFLMSVTPSKVRYEKNENDLVITYIDSPTNTLKMFDYFKSEHKRPFEIAFEAGIEDRLKFLDVVNLLETSSIVKGDNQANDLLGTSFSDVMIGGMGNDTLNGAYGYDFMKGGLGNDTYYVSNIDKAIITETGEPIINAIDTVLEYDDEGIDTIYSALADYSLPDYVENLVLTDSYTPNGTGNALDNTITGTNGKNSLNGELGNDTLFALQGDDSLSGGLGDDSLFGGEGNDIYLFSAEEIGQDVIEDNHGDNVLTLGGVLREQLTVTQRNHDVVVTISAEQSITIRNFDISSSATYQIETDDEAFNLIDVVPENTPPLAEDDSAFAHAQRIEIDVLANDIDSEGDILILESVTSDSTLGLFAVEDGQVTFTPNMTGSGDVFATYTVADSFGHQVEANIHIIIENNAPLASADVFEILSNEPTVLNVLSNDVDSDLDALLITQIHSESTLGIFAIQDDKVVFTAKSDTKIGQAVASYTITDIFGVSSVSTIIANINIPLIIISGSQGADLLKGNNQNNTFIINDSHDVVFEEANGGIDSVQSTLSHILRDNVENLMLVGDTNLSGTGNNADNNLTGNNGKNRLLAGDGNDTLSGGAGSDTLNGGSGADQLFGGTGNDTFIVENTADMVTEFANEGFDTVNSFISYTLTANIERLILEGIESLNGFGNDLDNTLNGNNANNWLVGGLGNDTLEGKGGADILEGGLGDDIYYVDEAGDTVTELAGEGIDKVNSSVNHTLTINVEQLYLTGIAALLGVGNDLDNIIYGNSGNNALNGGIGNDSLNGGLGNDILQGGAGNDTLVGGLGDDTYRFGTDSDRDTINNQDSAGNDVLALAAGIGAEQVWLRQLGEDLEISIIGTASSVKIQGWYTDNSQNHLDSLKLSEGNILLFSEVQTLVNAMAAFTPPPVGQTSLTTEQRAALSTTIAIAWEVIS
jgi:Ca2+-binding RTX toxin-like protein